MWRGISQNQKQTTLISFPNSYAQISHRKCFHNPIWYPEYASPASGIPDNKS